jgi:hypothetical protein
VRPLPEQAAGLTVAGDRDEQTHVPSERVRGQGVDGRIGVHGQVPLGLGRHHDALDGDRGAEDRVRPRDTAEQALEVRRARQVLLLDRAERSLRQVRSLALRPQVWLALHQVGRGDQGEQARVLVPAGRGHVAFGVEGGD